MSRAWTNIQHAAGCRMKGIKRGIFSYSGAILGKLVTNVAYRPHTLVMIR